MEEVSRRRNWLSSERFRELYAISKILPGPISTQMAIYLGYLRTGIPGGLLSGTLFVLPSFFLVLGLNSLYLGFGTVKNLGLAFTGMQASAFVFGTGLAIVTILEADVVQRFQWPTHSEFIDGLAMGQITPGPVVITATFIGYKTAGLLGAILGTTTRCGS